MALTIEQKLINELGVGKSEVQSADTLSLALNLDAQRTDEGLRQLIRDCIINEKWPIGSNINGYFIRVWSS